MSRCLSTWQFRHSFAETGVVRMAGVDVSSGGKGVAVAVVLRVQAVRARMEANKVQRNLFKASP